MFGKSRLLANFTFGDLDEDEIISIVVVFTPNQKLYNEV